MESKKKVIKIRVPCEFCDKTFSKVANKNHHVKTKHKGRRYICGICKDDDEKNEKMTSKFAYKRHMKRVHKIRELKNVDEAEHYVADSVEMMESAKDALIIRLQKELEEKNNELAELRRKYNLLSYSSSSPSEVSADDENDENDFIKENDLWDGHHLGPFTPIQLIQTLIFNNMKYFNIVVNFFITSILPKGVFQRKLKN